MRHRAKDAVGKTFNRLTVIDLAGRNRFGHMLANCICSCGNKCKCEVTGLWVDRPQSCGCLQREAIILTARTHGGSRVPTCRILSNDKPLL